MDHDHGQHGGGQDGPSQDGDRLPGLPLTRRVLATAVLTHADPMKGSLRDALRDAARVPLPPPGEAGPSRGGRVAEAPPRRRAQASLPLAAVAVALLATIGKGAS